MSAIGLLRIARSTISAAKEGTADNLPDPQELDQKIKAAVGPTLSAGETAAVRHFVHGLLNTYDKIEVSERADKIRSYKETLQHVLRETEFSLSGHMAEYVRWKVSEGLTRATKKLRAKLPERFAESVPKCRPKRPRMFP